MDLTYMPGELDYKNVKKDNGSDLKREHDSVDDFEHLDPELTPVDMQPKDFSPVEKIDTKSKNVSDMNHKLLDPVTESIFSEDKGSVSKSSESLTGNILSNKDLLSDFDMDLHETKTNIGSENLNKPSLFDVKKDGDVSPTVLDENLEENPSNTNFIIAEKSNIEKTEIESDLLNLDSKVKDNDKDAEDMSVDKVNESINNGNTLNKEFDNSKSMKEADALSQYDIKYEKKDTIKPELVAVDHNDLDPLPVSGQHGLEPFTFETKSELIKPEPQLPKLEPELPKFEVEEPQEPQFDKTKLESEEPKSETVKVQEEYEEKHEKEIPSKPYVAICPSKSTPADSVTESGKKTSHLNLDDIIGPEDVFKRIGLDAWFKPERLHPIVEALVYWRDPKKSGVVFGGIMAILLSLCYMSLISVVAYSSLLTLVGTICFRIYKNILQAVQKTSEGHPFKELLELELSLPQDKVREMVDTAVVHVNAAIVELRRLFLVEDLIDSIKFGVSLWCLTYVGAIFNGMTIVILAFVALFTVPKIYENNKTSIDTYIDMGRSKVAEITSKVKAAVPIGKKEPEKDKEQ